MIVRVRIHMAHPGRPKPPTSSFVHWYTITDSTGRHDKDHLSNRQTESLFDNFGHTDLLNEYGSQGWELVGVHIDKTAKRKLAITTYTFKR